MRRSAAVLAVFAAAALPAPAHAAAPWSDPVSIGPTATTVAFPGVAIPGASAPVFSGTFPAAGGGVDRLMRAEFERTLTGLVTAPVAPALAPEIVVVTSRNVPNPPLDVRVVPVVGDGGTARRLSRRAVPQSASVAVTSRGDVAVAFTEPDRRRSRLRVRLVVRRAGRRFGRPVTVATGLVGAPTAGNQSSGGVAVALGERGELLVAYQRDARRGRRRLQTVEARSGTLGGGLGRPQRLGPQQGAGRLEARVASRGRAAVAWLTQDSGEEANEPQRVHAALRAAGARRFARSQVLDPGGPAARGAGRLGLTVGPDGAVTAAWSSVRGSFRQGLVFPVRAAVAPPGRRFGAQRELAPSGAVGDVVTDGTGAAVVVFTDVSQATLDPARYRVLAAARPAGADAFGRVEEIAGPEASEAVRAAVDPRTGRVVAAWVGTVQDEPRLQAVRSATRG